MTHHCYRTFIVLFIYFIHKPFYNLFDARVADYLTIFQNCWETPSALSRWAFRDIVFHSQKNFKCLWLQNMMTDSHCLVFQRQALLSIVFGCSVSMEAISINILISPKQLKVRMYEQFLFWTSQDTMKVSKYLRKVWLSARGSVSWVT